MIKQNPYLLFTFSIIAVLALNTPAKADSKGWLSGWGKDHWEFLDHQPYLMPPSDPHDRQWDIKDWHGNGWKPEDWISRSSSKDVVDGFFRADIFREKDIDDDIPVLVVGPNFYRLSGYDKRRVTETMNYVYEATRSPAGHFQLKDQEYDIIIGYYDDNGLRLR